MGKEVLTVGVAAREKCHRKTKPEVKRFAWIW